MLRTIVISILYVVITFNSLVFSLELPTPGEQSRYRRYTTNAEIGRFLCRLQQASAKGLTVRIIGESQEREPIYLVTLRHQAEKNDSLLKVFIIATQHGDEQSGKEACLRLIRDVAIGPLTWLLDRMELFIIPLVNPYGSHHDQRVNGQGLDLNRDHVKLESPELRAVHRCFNEIFPHITLDVHEKGEDYYLENMGLVSNANISPKLQHYGRENILPFIERQLAQKNIPFHEYLIRERVDLNEASGAKIDRKAPKNPHYYYRYSTTDINDGRNSFGIYNTLSFILEGASSGRLDDLEQRTNNQYQAILAFLQYGAAHATEIIHLVASAREQMLPADGKIKLRMHYQADSARTPLRIKALAQTGEQVLGTLKRDKLAGDEISWRDIQPLDAKRRKVEDRTITDWRPMVTTTVSRPIPAAYAIPPEYAAVIRTLSDHGIALFMLEKDQQVPVHVLQVIHLRPAEADYMAPDSIIIEATTKTVILRQGTMIVPVAGRHRLLVPILLEPESEYGLVRYEYYQLLPEEGGFYPIYRLNSWNDLPVIPFWAGY